MRRLLRALIPRPWRDTVMHDLEKEACERGKGSFWVATQMARVGIRLQPVINGDALMSDIRYALRSLWRAKGFTLAATITLTLGIGVNLGVFNIVDRVLFRPLPFAHESRLVMVTPGDPATGSRGTAFAKGLFVASRDTVQAIEDMGYVSSFPADSYVVPGAAGPALVMSDASFNVLDVLGCRPVVGRGFTRADAEARAPLAVITHEAWQTRFGGKANVLGRQIGTGAGAKTIIGVLPPGFIRPVPNRWGRSDGLVLDDELLEGGPLQANLSPAVARLAPGATISQAQQQFDVVALRMDSQLRRPGAARGPRVVVDGLRAGMFTQAYRYLWLVTLAATLLGWLTAVNLSGLLLARGRSRGHQVALRGALGASRARILSTELIESLVICGVAGTVAAVFIYWTSAALVALVPAHLQPFVLTTIDGRFAVYAAGLVLVSGAVGGLMPAWRASRTDLLTVLQKQGGVPAHAGTRRLGRSLLAFEAAVGVILVTGAAIVLRSFIGLAATDLGFNPVSVQEVRVKPDGQRRGGDDEAELARYRAVLEVIRRRPEVVAAGASDSMPGGGAAPMMGATWNREVPAGLWRVSEGWFETVSVRIIAGNTIRKVDVDEARPVALITKGMARQLWPGDNIEAAVGRELSAAGQPTRQIIGVLDDILDQPTQAAKPRVFVPVTPEGTWFLVFAVRTAGQALDQTALARELAGDLGVTSLQVRAAGGISATVLQGPRLQALIFGGFAVVGLLVAAVGLYAATSFDVALRRYELGVRVALGASAIQIRRLVVGESLRPVALGVCVGVVAAYWAASVLEALVFGIDVRDPGIFALVTAVLLGTSVFAAWIPAHRAGRVDPAIVLRAD